MSKEKTDKTIKFIYNKPDDYTPVYVNGVHGGVNPRGDLLCHFFFEGIDAPCEEDVPFINGVLHPEKTKKIPRIEPKTDELIVMRDLKVGLIIPLHQVKSIANWMLQQHKTVEEQKKEIAETTNKEE